MILTLLVFLIILSVLVLIHEAGHYFVAKKLGMKVEEFGFGLPPRIWGVKRGETIYSVNWLPIGGFVKIYGEDEAGSGSVQLPKNKERQTKNKKDEQRAFYSRPVWQRAVTIVAGVVMNTLLAIVIFYVFMFISGFKTELPLIGNYHFFGVNESVRTDVLVSAIEPNSPASKAAIPPGAQFVRVAGRPVTSLDQFTNVINNHKGEPLTLTWKDPKTQAEVTKTLTPRKNPPKNQGAVGIALFGSRTAVLNYQTPLQKIFSGIIHPANLLVYNFDLIGKLIGLSIKEHNAAPIGQGVAGPVGIYSLVGTIVQIPDLKERILQILNLAGILSISLAFFNVLPIPALDGGRLFFILIEGIFGKKIKPEYEALAHTIGMVVLLALIVLITFKDIFQFLL